MKRWNLLAALSLLSVAFPVHADIQHSITSSAQITVGAASTTATRMPSTYSVSGSGVDTAIGDNAGQLSAGTITSGIYSPGTVVGTQNATGGESFSFSSSYIQGDAVPTSAPTVGTVGNFSSQTSTKGGTAASLAGGVTSAGVISLTAGGENTTAIGSIQSQITID
tara:strand:- start:1154 stop:1651 length:498 start_codon:yes stop_codon:yes gene_type:complete